MISVIIPTCDRPLEFLTAAINSVLEQSLKPAEVIVVDNGRNRVDQNELHAQVKLLTLPPRVGVSRARNEGAASATGTYLAFLDDDDFWDRDFLKEAWEIVEATGARCVYGRKDAYRDGEQSHYKTPDQSKLSIDILLKSNPGTGGMNLFIAKELYTKIGGFDEKLGVSEDRALAIEVLRTGEKIAAAPKAIAVMRVHDGDRLRKNPIARLPFIWKYKSLIGLPGTITRTVSILSKALRIWIRGSAQRHKA